jgi:small nuclear ribonucleoprotein (snRNP)-like protein
MYEKITTENVMMFAIKHYDNPQCEGEKEFHDDMKRFKYIKRLLRKYKDSGILKERLLLNHIIILNNLFGPEACVTLLLFKIQQEYWGTLKSFLLYLNMIREDELSEIKEDVEILKALKEL